MHDYGSFKIDIGPTFEMFLVPSCDLWALLNLQINYSHSLNIKEQGNKKTTIKIARKNREKSVQTVNVTFQTELIVSGKAEELNEPSPAVCFYFETASFVRRGL
jgi:hypothetical protein